MTWSYWHNYQGCDPGEGATLNEKGQICRVRIWLGLCKKKLLGYIKAQIISTLMCFTASWATGSNYE